MMRLVLMTESEGGTLCGTMETETLMIYVFMDCCGMNTMEM